MSSIYIFWQNVNAIFLSSKKHACEPLLRECKLIDQWQNMGLQVDCATCKPDIQSSHKCTCEFLLSISRSFIVKIKIRGLRAF